MLLGFLGTMDGFYVNSSLNLPSPLNLPKPNESCEQWSTSNQFDWNNLYDSLTFAIDVYIVGGLCLFGFVGNGLSIAVLRRDHDKKNATNWLLQTLAILDTAYLVACLFIQPLNSLRHLSWMAGLRRVFPYMERYTWAAASTAQTATIWMLVLVTTDRFTAICQPLKTDLRSLPRARLAVFIVVALAIVYNIPLFFEREVVHITCGGSLHFFSEKTQLRLDYTYYLIYKTTLFFIFRTVGPLVALTVLNLRLISALRAVRRRRRAMNKRQSTAKPRESITLMLVTVVSVFIVCELPDVGLRLTVTFMELLPASDEDFTDSHGPTIRFVNSITNMLMTLNSSVNFVIYCLVGHKFRGILRQICLVFCCGRRSTVPPTIEISETEMMHGACATDGRGNCGRLNVNHSINHSNTTNV